VQLGLTSAPDLHICCFGTWSPLPVSGFIRMLQQHGVSTVACMCLRRAVCIAQRAKHAPRPAGTSPPDDEDVVRKEARDVDGRTVRRPCQPAAALRGERVLHRRQECAAVDVTPFQDSTQGSADMAVCSVEAPQGCAPPLGRVLCLRIRSVSRHFQGRSMCGGTGGDSRCGRGRRQYYLYELNASDSIDKPHSVSTITTKARRRHRRALGLLSSLAAHPRMLCRPCGHTCSADQERPLVFPCRAAQWA